MFAIPAIILGFLICFPSIGLIFIFIFEEKLENGFEVMPSKTACLYGLFVGLIVPVMSSIMPIVTVLKQSLVDSLDYERSRVKSMYVDVL